MVSGVNLRTYQWLSDSVEVLEPQRRTERVSIEGIDTVILCGRIDHIVRPARNRQTGNIENPGINLVVHWKHEELSKLARINVRSGKNSLGEVRTGTLIVIISG